MRLILLLIALTAILWGCDKNRNGQNTPTEKATEKFNKTPAKTTTEKSKTVTENLNKTDKLQGEPENNKTDSLIPPTEKTAEPVKPAVPMKTTESGLQYGELTKGTGPTPKTGQFLTVNYTGWLEDGTEFAKTDKKNPYTFQFGLGMVIKGWEEGLSQMSKGGKSKFIVPYQLGYGEKGLPDTIPPKATLIFEIELLEIGLSSGEKSPRPKLR